MVNNFEQLKQIADLISAQFGPSTEVVLHDFTGELDHTIVYIVNGHVTGRTVGDAPTQSFLEYMNTDRLRGPIEKKYDTFLISPTAESFAPLRRISSMKTER